MQETHMVQEEGNVIETHFSGWGYQAKRWYTGQN